MNVQITVGDLIFLIDAFKYLRNHVEMGINDREDILEIIDEAENLLNQIGIPEDVDEQFEQFREFVGLTDE